MSEEPIQETLAHEADASESSREDELPYLPYRRPARDPSQVYSLRIPVRRLDELRSLAEEQDVGPSVLMRRWVLERLDEEGVVHGEETPVTLIRGKLTHAYRLLEEVRRAEEHLIPETG